MSHFGSVASFSCAGARPGALLIAFIALALAGCARQQGQQVAHTTPAAPRSAVCEPRPAPDCRFKETTLKTVDPTEFDRLKSAYERRCLRHAQKTERERMRELQASGACGGRPAPSLATTR